MTIDTDELSATLGRLANRDPVRAAPVGAVLGRARRARRAHTAVTAGVVTALVAAGATAGGIAWTAREDKAPVVAGGDTPDLRLAAAVRATAQASYRFTMTWTWDGEPAGAPQEGAFDPAGPTGYLRGTIGTLYIDQRVVDGDWYTGTRPEGMALFWVKEKPGFTGFALHAGTELTADPSALLKAFTSQGTVTYTGRTGTGGDAVDVYAFSARPPGGDAVPTTGTIEVGVQSGRVRKITWRAQADRRWYTDTAVFSDYGTDVEVERPM
ncbi:hypothetical protein [Dactylosporangium sp. CA-092794]|uniref:hypothetical protein n=1 Tax=Dactylosporangium sp. CA-092794 TaxID=3239929 RepID=UPI003D8F59C6